MWKTGKINQTMLYQNLFLNSTVSDIHIQRYYLQCVPEKKLYNKLPAVGFNCCEIQCKFKTFILC